MYKGEEGRKAYEEANPSKSNDDFVAAVDLFRKEKATQAEMDLIEERDKLSNKLEDAEQQNEALMAQVDAKQAKIDELMLEYCPDDMTPEQIEEWGKRQIVI